MYRREWGHSSACIDGGRLAEPAQSHSAGEDCACGLHSGHSLEDMLTSHSSRSSQDIGAVAGCPDCSATSLDRSAAVLSSQATRSTAVCNSYAAYWDAETSWKSLCKAHQICAAMPGRAVPGTHSTVRVPAKSRRGGHSGSGQCLCEEDKARLKGTGRQPLHFQTATRSETRCSQAGGCLPSIDLSQPFDRVNHTKLDCALEKHQDDEEHLIPMCDATTYLGTKLSLHEGADGTLEYRLAGAR